MALNQLGLFPLPEGDFPAAGSPPELAWLSLSALRIDEDYQRPVGRAGLATISRIVREFDWAKFAPVVVAPLAGGLYAVIDGQHRSIAAKARGFDRVPCQIHKLTPAQQASSFAAINGNVTAITPLALYKASLAGGAPWACEIDRVARGAGVTILAYPKPLKHMRAGETMAVGIVGKEIARSGPERVGVALRAMMESSHAIPGNLSGTIIKVMCLLLTAHPGWIADATRLARALSTIAPGNPLHHYKMTDLTFILDRGLSKALGAGLAASGPVAARHSEIAALRARKDSVSAIAAKLKMRYGDVRAALERLGLT